MRLHREILLRISEMEKDTNIFSIVLLLFKGLRTGELSFRQYDELSSDMLLKAEKLGIDTRVPVIN